MSGWSQVWKCNFNAWQPWKAPIKLCIKFEKWCLSKARTSQPKLWFLSGIALTSQYSVFQDVVHYHSNHTHWAITVALLLGFRMSKLMLRQQVFGTMLLLLGIFAVTDERNMSPPKGLIPFVVGLIIFLIGLSFAWNCGYALNPARDLSPRLFTAIAGWGSKTFRYRYHRRRHSHQLLYVCI